jgi:prepilin peptidase CpaA
MTQHLFFPDPVFGWTFYGVLVGITFVASYFDLRSLTIPKSLSVAALALGVIFNVVRGAWLAAEGQPVWGLEASSGFSGGLFGLLFSLAGFGVGFALFFLMWILGTCGGGDVKLFAALGAWVGPLWAIYVLMGTLIFVILLSALKLLMLLITRGFKPVMKDYSAKEGKRWRGRKPVNELAAGRPRRRLMAYSLPVALSTALILLWVFRVELLGATAVEQGRAQAAADIRL